MYRHDIKHLKFFCSLIVYLFLHELCSLPQIPDCFIITITTVLLIVRHLIHALALQPWLLYLGCAFDMLGGYTFSSTRSIISQCVERDELGKVFAILASLVPIGMSQA